MDERSWIKRRIVELGGPVLLGLFVLLWLMLKTLDNAENALLFELIFGGVLAVLSIVRAVLFYSLEKEDRPDYPFKLSFRWRWRALFDYEEYREWRMERYKGSLHPLWMAIIFSILFLVALAGELFLTQLPR